MRHTKLLTKQVKFAKRQYWAATYLHISQTLGENMVRNAVVHLFETI